MTDTSKRTTTTNETNKVYNIATYVRAAVLPYIVAMTELFNSQLLYLSELAQRVVDKDTGTDELIAELQRTILLNNQKVIEYKEEVAGLRRNTFTANQLEEQILRTRELSSICQIIYNLVKDNFPEDVTATMPDFKEPYRYPVELEMEWRKEEDINEEVELTEEQIEELRAYIQRYYTDNPTKQPPEDLFYDYGGSAYPIPNDVEPEV